MSGPETDERDNEPDVPPSIEEAEREREIQAWRELGSFPPGVR